MSTVSTRKQTVRYRYDALGRRVQRFTVGGKENTKFIYDGQDVLVDDNSGTLTKYLNGEGIDNKLRMQTGSDIQYFLTDHLGSTNGLADSSGNITSSASYDSFGNATGNINTRYQFTGREYDNFTGLHYYRARWYDANLGRFISEDPIGLAGGDVNLYEYVWSNPQNWTDPTGLYPFKLPANPSQLPQGWTPDNTHKNPNGSRWTSPSGDSKLEFEPGRAGQNGWKGKDHWHKWVPDPKRPGKWVKDENHSKPGDEVEIEFSSCPLPKPQLLNQPTMEELRLQIEAAQQMEQFWTKILIGSAIGGAVYLAPGIIPALIPQVPRIAQRAPQYGY